MTQQLNKSNTQSLTAEQVSEYLLSEPAFFNQFPHLLEGIQVDSPSGGVVSLTMRQLAVLREKNHTLQGQLNTLLDIARDNDTLFGHMQRLTTDLLDARCEEDVFATLDDSLQASFKADFFAIRIMSDVDNDFPISEVIWDKDSSEYEHFKRVLESEEIKCGHPTHAQAKALFQEKADEVQSTAYIPFKIEQQQGLLVIGSRDAERFHPSMGNLFLAHLGQLVAKRLASLSGLNT